MAEEEEGLPDEVRVMPENQEEVEVIAAGGEVTTARASPGSGGAGELDDSGLRRNTRRHGVRIENRYDYFPYY